MNNGWVKDEYGDSFHLVNGKLHNDNGPALIRHNGTKKWYKNSVPHREDGPAFEYAVGDKFWFYNGYIVDVNSNEEFIAWLKFKAFM